MLGSLVLASAGGPTAASPSHGPAVGGTVFSGPTHAHPSSLQINPAALTRGSLGWHLYFGGALRADQITIEREKVDPASGALSPGAEVSGTPLTPTGIVSAYRVLSAGAIGITLGIPDADNGIRDQAPVGYHVLESSERRLKVMLGGALRLPSKRAFLGVSLSLVRTSHTVKLLRDSALDAGSDPALGVGSDCGGQPCGFENPLASQTWEINVNSSSLVSTQSLGVTVGLLFLLGDLDDPWLVGLSLASGAGLRSPVSLTGTSTINLAERDGGEQVSGRAELIEQPTQALWLGGRGAIIRNYELVVGLRYENSGRDRGLDIRTFGMDLADASIPERLARYRGYDDIVTLEAGLEQRDVGKRARGGARLRWESGLVDGDEITARDVAGQNLGIELGGELRIGQRIVIDFTYGSRYYPTITSEPGVFDPRAHVACIDSGYAYDACEASRDGLGAPTAAGRYHRFSHAMRLGLRYDFL